MSLDVGEQQQIQSLIAQAGRVHMPGTILADLAEHESQSVRSTALMNPSTPSHVLLRRAALGEINDIVAVTGNPKAPVEFLERELKIIEYAHYEKKNHLSVWVEKHTRRIARNPNATSEILHRILCLPEGKDDVVRKRSVAVASNPSATSEVLIAAAKRIPTGIHLAADESRSFVRHPQANDAVLCSVYDKVQSKTKTKIAELPTCGPLTIAKILRSRAELAKAAIVKRCPHLATDQLASIRSSHAVLQTNLTQHPNVSPQILSDLSSSSDTEVRFLVAQHEYTPYNVRVVLGFDNDPTVAAEAVKMLERLRSTVGSAG